MRKIWGLLILVCCYSGIQAQQNLGQTKTAVHSPVVQTDHRVTLSIKAPHAKSVQVKGDWLAQNAAAELTRNASGVWTYTSEQLPSDLYTYQFVVDGVNQIDPVNPYAVRDVGSLYSLFLIGEGNGDLYKTNAVSHGTVACRWYSSPTLGVSRRMTIYTPPGYETNKKTYPTLYLLHGMGGDETAWPTLGRSIEILDNLIAAKKVQPMVVVMPNGNVSQTAAPGVSDKGFAPISFNLPHTMDGVFESSFRDIQAFIESHYRVGKTKADRAIAGLSMGGFHSLYIAANYPNTFDYIGLFSPAITPPFGDSSAIYQQMDQKLKAQLKNGFKLYWIGIGKEDFLMKDVAAFRQRLDKLHFPYTYHESDRWHMWSNWRKYLVDFLPQLFQ